MEYSDQRLTRYPLPGTLLRNPEAVTMGDPVPLPLAVRAEERAVAAPTLAQRLAEIDLTGTGWMDRAACAESGGDAWFPGKGEDSVTAKRVCRGCEVRAECLDYALARSEGTFDIGRFGTWGGVTEYGRMRMARGRRREGRAA